MVNEFFQLSLLQIQSKRVIRRAASAAAVFLAWWKSFQVWGTTGKRTPSSACAHGCLKPFPCACNA
jgi:hypothetical protein